MQVYDRLKSVTIDVNSLPSHIDLGRYYMVDPKEDLTNRVINFGSDKYIDQALLDSKYKSLQELFCYFHISTNEIGENDFTLVPLIQRVKEKLFLNKFEELLESKIFHLEEIFRQPHYLLQRTIEKVNVSRAKRIPAKSYQNLASHTEDWLHKSIVDFKPRRILNEELELQFDIYENQVSVALIERCLKYLNSRIQELEDIKKFLGEYVKLLNDRNDSAGWYEKINRNLTLIGHVYEDEHYSGEISRDEILSKTHKNLLQMLKRLKALKASTLYEEVNHRIVQNCIPKRDIIPTNVIANHKHYRYVRELWLALNKVDLEKSEAERSEYEQEVIDGVRCYAKVLLAYIMSDILKYKLNGTYSKWSASHFFYPEASFEETEDNHLLMCLGQNSFNFLVLCNDPKADLGEESKDSYILALNSSKSTEKQICINPYDADSVERVGKIIRTYIIKNYVFNLRQQFLYPQVLRDYVGCIVAQDVIFLKDYHYVFKGIPLSHLEKETAVDNILRNQLFNNRSRLDKDMIKKNMESLIDQINDNAEKLSGFISCPCCLRPMPRRNQRQLDYLSFDCGFVLDSSSNHVIFYNADPKYSNLKEDDWGMDYIKYYE